MARTKKDRKVSEEQERPSAKKRRGTLTPLKKQKYRDYYTEEDED